MPPARFQAALDRVGAGQEQSIAFRDFVAARREIIRRESTFRVFHTQDMFDDVSAGTHLGEPSFQRFLAAQTELIRATGCDVNSWRYAEEPVAATRAAP